MYQYRCFGKKNLCPNFLYTGWDQDDDYAEHTTVPESFVYRIPERFDSLERMQRPLVAELTSVPMCL